MKGGTNKEENGLRGLKYEGRQMDDEKNWIEERIGSQAEAELRERKRGGGKGGAELKRVMKQGG